MTKKLPIGIENFEEFVLQDFYYVDKTMFIAELLWNWGKVNLFTRPRRFGKSLNMSMLKAFFELGSDKTLFDGLRISQERELCEKYMGQFPVVSVTLKSVDALTFEEAKEALKTVIGKEAERLSYLADSEKLTMEQKKAYQALVRIREDGNYAMSDVAMKFSLLKLSELMARHHGRKVLILIDEYDVPLDKAFQAGYYDKMAALISNLFGNALKTNEYLHFAVLTGCLRISKESIFTGLNNLKVHPITDVRYDEYFGFTDEDVNEMLEYYGFSDRAGVVREWYDGYQFGNVSVYCPWDVINYCDALLENPDAEPENYWANTSGNAMVRRFIGKANRQTRSEIERLIEGESIVKEVSQELTYNELDKSIDNLWSVLFSTGYLTQRGRLPGNQYRLVIPNREIKALFISQIQEWFRETTRAEAGKLGQFCRAFVEGDAEVIEQMLKGYLWNSISIRDTAVRTEMKENFYHGMLLGLLQYADDWEVESNAESGEDYSDITIKTQEGTGVVIEIKYAENGSLERACTEALVQIEEKQYDAVLLKDGMERVIRYGIAFYKKNCRVLMAG